MRHIKPFGPQRDGFLVVQPLITRQSMRVPPATASCDAGRPRMDAPAVRNRLANSCGQVDDAICPRSCTKGCCPEEQSRSRRISASPALQVGLIGVAPRRNAVSATETAQAVVTLQTTITHPDPSTAPGRRLRVRLRRFERQLSIGQACLPTLRTSSFSASTTVRFPCSTPSRTTAILSTRDSVWTPYPRNVLLGTFQPGDMVSYVWADSMARA